MKKLSTEEFIRRSIIKHGDVYDYSQSEYYDASTKISISCKKHGTFTQLPHSHMNVSGCPSCTKEKKQKTTEQFIIEATNIHGGLYDYSKSIYVHSKEKVIIGCVKHGDFLQSPNPHLKGHGCPDCKKETLSQLYRLDTETFIDRAVSVHGDRYIYDKVLYVTNKVPVQIGCSKHGYFMQRPDSHIFAKKGCAMCNNSHGVSDIIKILRDNNIEISMEHRFPDCKNKTHLPFDIFIEQLNVCIEYDGIQHYEEIEAWGGLESLQRTQYHDSIKNNYCHDNGIKLLRIRYDEEHTSVLKEYFKNTFNIDLKD